MTTSVSNSRWQLRRSALYDAVNGARISKGLSWRQVASETGLSPSTLTRLGAGSGLDANSLLSLLAWLGHADALRPYVQDVWGTRSIGILRSEQ